MYRIVGGVERSFKVPPLTLRSAANEIYLPFTFIIYPIFVKAKQRLCENSVINAQKSVYFYIYAIIRA